MGAETYNVDLSHSGRENSEKIREEQGATIDDFKRIPLKDLE
jgi:hypothetical protein